MGDGIQAAKAGILEIGDVFVVNKADRDGADNTVRDLRHMISLGERREAEDWRPPVIKTVASTGDGVAEVAEALIKHFTWATGSGELAMRRQRRAAGEIEVIVLTELRRRIGDLRDGDGVAVLATDVAEGRRDPYSAADEVLEGLELKGLEAIQRSPLA
jgi:LAO/AO transport system kinase